MSGHINILPYALKLAQEYRWAKGVQTVRSGLLVRVSAWGFEGFAESAPPIHLAVNADTMAEEVRALTAGIPVEAEDFLARIDSRGVPARMRAGIAAAWMSACAAAAGQPLGALIGMTPGTIIPVNGLVTEKTPEQATARAAALLAEGYRMIKVKCWDARASDLARVAAIRAAAPAAKLRLDANEAWHQD